MERLAKITKAQLEIKEHGVLTFWIFVDYEEGGSQGIGGFALDAYAPEKKHRVGSAFGCEMILRLLLTLDVDDFSEMAGKVVWVIGEGDSPFSFKPKGLRLPQISGVAGRKQHGPLIFDEVAAEFGLDDEANTETEQ